jgi:chitodextrinase
MRVPADTPWPKRVLLAIALGLVALVAGGSSAANAAGLAPTPTGFRTTGVTTTTVSLAWNASVLAAGYGVYRNGTRIASTTGTAYTVTGLACGTTYTLAVDAADVLGGRSDPATLTAATAACPGDTSPPSAPPGLSATGSTATSISVSWSASTDDVGVTGYGLYRNGTLDGSTSASVRTYTFTGLACGTQYTLAADAADAAGNRSTRSQVTASTTGCADTSPPSAPPSFASTGATTTSISVSWGASSDNVGVTGYGLYRDGSSAGSVGAGARSYTFAGLACGTQYTLAVDAADVAGNRSARSQLTASTSACPGDTTPPSQPPSLSTTGTTTTSISVSWGASTDNVGVTGYGVYRNGTQVGSTGSGTRTYTYSGLACGTTYTLGVDAVDAAGNRSSRRTTSAATSACSGGGGCTVSNTSGCVPRTTLTFMDGQFVCDRPLSSYGPLPLKVVADYTPGRRYGGNGAVDLTSGCAGDGNAQTIDLIVEVRGDGRTYGPGVDAVKVRLEAGYDGGIQLTGRADCGPRVDSSAHADGVQLQGGRDITFVDFTIGNYDAGTSTCQGAGGAFFYSGAGGYTPQNVSVVRGKYIACNHALNATQARSGSVTNASFRSGRTDGSDPVCTGFAASPACQDIDNVQHAGVVCQNWSGTRWE